MNSDLDERCVHMDNVASIVAAYISRNPVAADEVPSIISAVHSALCEADRQPDALPVIAPQERPRLRLVHSV